MTTLQGGGSTTATPVNIELTPMRVSWSGTDLGATSGNVVVTLKTSKQAITADQYGKTTLDERWNGFECLVTTELLELRSFATWNELFPSMTYVAGASGSIVGGIPMGRSDLTNAQALNLHPLVNADANLTQDWNFFLAHPSEDSSVTYGPGGESKVKMVWRVFPALTGSGAPKFFKYGT